MRLSPRSFFGSRYARRAFVFYFGSVTAFLGLALGLVYFVAISALQKNERQLVELKTSELSAIFAKDGIEGLRAQHSWAYIRLKNRNGTLALENGPTNEPGYVLSELDDLVRPPYPKKPIWLKLYKHHDEDVLNVLAKPLPSDLFLEVGKSDGDLNDQIEILAGRIAKIIGPLFLLALVIAFFATRSAIGPMLQLFNTLRQVKSGSLSSRVPTGEGAGEIHDLVQLFNAMLDQIESLVNQTRGEVDQFAHDIRTPIAGFRILAESALTDGTENVEALRTALEEAIQSADQIMNLITTIFDITLTESGSLRIDRQPFDLSAVVAQVCELYAYPAEERGIQIVQTHPPSFLFNGDSARIRRAVANLLDNAVKYSDPNSAIEVEVRTTDREVSIAIRDEGPGIAEADRPRIWEKLFRGSNADRHEGFGLGLSLVKGIAEAHGGTVVSQAATPRGTRFVLSLPRV
jgi:signal transduction histidine kinase